ncbi:MAG: glutamate-1-semialdehyde 2,1-aminomutase [Oligoflexia bacterium]|nr:glutamate-1-semialdehyde 2,1-aminomutase [Oligoflexia bacterium]
MSEIRQVTAESAALFERAKKVSPGGVHSPVRAFKGVGGTPRFIRSAEGVRLTDVDGNRYTDYCMSWGPMIFGHQDQEIAEAVRGALSRGWSYGTAEPYSLELAELITGALPWVEKIRFVNSGTEAVMAALRVARAATGRTKVLKFDGAYHGHLDQLLVRAGSGLAEMASPDSAGVAPSVAADTIVVPLDDWAAYEQALARHGHELAVVCFEAIPANNGLLLQRADFLPKAAAAARKAGALVLLDEVITGFRVAFGGVAEQSGVSPDLVTYGKIIGGGFPVGAYGGKRELMDLVAPQGPVYQAGTLSANPVAMTAGLATLKKLKRDNPYRKLEEKTESLARKFERVARDAGAEVSVQRHASMFWAVLGKIGTVDGVVRSTTQTPATQKERYAKLFHSLLAQGQYLAPSGFEVSFLSTAHQDSDLDALVAAFKGAL